MFNDAMYAVATIIIIAIAQSNVVESAALSMVRMKTLGGRRASSNC